MAGATEDARGARHVIDGIGSDVVVGGNVPDVDAHPSTMSVAEILALLERGRSDAICWPERFDHISTRSVLVSRRRWLSGRGQLPAAAARQLQRHQQGSMLIGNRISQRSRCSTCGTTTRTAAWALRGCEATVDRNGERHDVPLLRRTAISPSTAPAVSGCPVVQGGTGVSAAVTGYRGKTARKPPYEHPPYRYVAPFVDGARERPAGGDRRRRAQYAYAGGVRGAGVLCDHAAGAGRRVLPAP
jgi:hypothetical protein